jgi:small-conductance mechanosensitive channel
MFRTYRLAILIGLLGLLGLTVVGLVLTRQGARRSPLENRAESSGTGQPSLVDNQPLVAARKLGGLAVTPEEQRFAEQALQLADQDVDLAFSIALRDVAEHSISLTPEGRVLQGRVKEAEAQVKSDKDEVALLTKQVAKAREDQKESLGVKLEQAQALLAFDQDELADAQRDLARAGGDEHSRLQRLLDEHERSLAHVSANGPSTSAANIGQAAKGKWDARSLVAEFPDWMQLREEQKELGEAQRDAMARAKESAQNHNSLEREMKEKASKKAAPAPQGTAAIAAAKGLNQAPAAGVTTAPRDLADLDKRIETEQKLGNVYRSWAALVGERELASVHRLIQSAFWIASILLLLLLADQLVNRYELNADRKRLFTARSVLRFTVRALGVVLILLVIFGPPSQPATVLALAGAGLTVALRDFIVGFFGWFVLMGRNGVRPGDWVEINGVQGKVIEVGLLHTVILETGNWTDAGHPTGRKVTFVNSFAIERHYFNFSTAGQWLWDEVQIGLPSGTNPYPIVEAIQKIVTERTDANARLAEQEWRRATTASGLHTFSAAPAISVRPTWSGVNVIVRYITRADERDDLRALLYRAVFDFLLGKNAPQPLSEGQVRGAAPSLG